MTCSNKWRPKGKVPTTVSELRVELTKLAKKRSGKQLITNKFSKDHLFSGHNGDIKKIGVALAKLRQIPKSTIMISSLDAQAQSEVLNWIKNLTDSKFTFNNGTWSIPKNGSAVASKSQYKFGIIDLKELKGMDKDDIIKKKRRWITISNKKPKITCLFDSDGTPMVFHMYY